MKKIFNKGFTLVELMVVIAIIAILTAIVTTNFTQSKAKARDAKRVSDIAQIQLALELAFDRCNMYPANINNPNTPINTGVCTKGDSSDYSLGDFISVVPKDPISNSSYEYHQDASGYDYLIRVILETGSVVLQDSVSGEPVISGNEYDCDPSTLRYCVQPR